MGRFLALLRAGLLLAGLGLAGLGLSGVAAADVVDRIAAVVDREVITLSEIYEIGDEYINEAARGVPGPSPARRDAELEVLDQLIADMLMAQELKRLGMDITQEELDRAVDDVARQNGMTRDQLRVAVETTANIPWTLYRQQLEDNLRQMKFFQVVLQPRVTVTEDEVLDRYKRFVRTYQGDESRELQAILLPWPGEGTPDDRAALATRMTEMRASLDAGTDWAALVSSTTDSKLHPVGGALGTFKKGEAVAEIDVPAFKVAVGEVSQPVALPNGMMLLRVASIQQSEPPPYELVGDQLMQEIIGEKAEREQTLWVEQAKRRSSVEVKLAPPAGP